MSSGRSDDTRHCGADLRGFSSLLCIPSMTEHEYPRRIAFVAELPKTPAGKVNRKVLRDREAGFA